MEPLKYDQRTFGNAIGRMQNAIYWYLVGTKSINDGEAAVLGAGSCASVLEAQVNWKSGSDWLTL